MRAMLILLLLPVCVWSQGDLVLTSYPSLTIAASSRGWAMGGTGIAGSTENQSLSFNVAGTAFTQNLHQASVYYTPWLPGVSTDAKFVHADYLGSLGNTSALGFAVNFLNMGTIAVRDDNGATLGLYKANEYNIGMSYALQLGGSASLGAKFTFLGQSIPGGSIKNTFSICGDLGYYQSTQLGDASHLLSWGATVRNLGANNHLPSSAGIGLAYRQHSQSNDQFMFTLDASRLLEDDWKGLRISTGAEYAFDEMFFLRGGVTFENKSKGNRKYFSLGAGYKCFVSDQSWMLDLHYLVPFGFDGGVSPFQNSYGLTLSFNIGNF
ncbi:MAG: PorV/PorQ family protein [Bacteroidota bacterium]